MKKTVLCFGDSFTWGSNPDGSGRHAYEVRWPSVLESALGQDVHIIAEGLRGRTTVYDDYTTVDDRNGARVLPMLLSTHSPLDLIIIMLGTNDLKSFVAGSAFAARQGMERLITLILHYPYSFGMTAPDILLVSPPHLTETANDIYAATFSGNIAQSKQLAVFYSDLADQYGCNFFDAASVAKASALDGVHLDEDNLKGLGRALASPVRMILGL